MALMLKLAIFLFMILSIELFDNQENNRSQCILPSACKLDAVNTVINSHGNNKFTIRETKGLRCQVYKNYQFEIDESIKNEQNCRLHGDIDIYNGIVELLWSKKDSNAILENSIHMENIFHLIGPLYTHFSLNLVNVKRFDLNLILHTEYDKDFGIEQLLCLGCNMEFYVNRQLVRSCDQILESNLTIVSSIFQIYKITLDLYDLSYNLFYKDYNNVIMINCEFKYPLCPLVFNGSLIRRLEINDLINSFYKVNVLRFTNLSDYDYFNSRILVLKLNNAQDIDLDLKLLNPLVFRQLTTINMCGSVRHISEEIFTSLDNLIIIRFQMAYFRKMMHSNGLQWIRSINANISVNMSDFEEVYYYKSLIRQIQLDCYTYIPEDSMEQIFPDKDFCLYLDFPFHQLVLLLQLCKEDIFDLVHTDITCTYLWLAKFYEIYYQVFVTSYYEDFLKRSQKVTKIYHLNIDRILSSLEYNITLAKCNFTTMSQLCNKSAYSHDPHIRGRHDYLVSNTKLKIVIKIASYVVSLFGIMTNLIVILLILNKNNSDLFKQFKQYTYLWINSVFSLFILLIQLLAWTSECFYPYSVFCPELRKFVVFQLFKMVFAECLVTTFRFMCNFTYVAFAFNRISLIGKDHGSLVRFISDVGVKTYLGVCLLISCCFSVIKYFKYEINYDQPETSYPISNELDLTSIYKTHFELDAFFIINLLSDLTNYVIFEIFIFVIDLYMVVRLRRTLDEKWTKSKSMYNEAKLELLKNENQKAMKKVIKMVILNTTISVVFKLPITFIPIINVYAEFYFKNVFNIFSQPHFGRFYSFLLDTGFYELLVQLPDFLYTFTLSIQLFIYICFDKKITIAFNRLISKEKKIVEDDNKKS